MKRIINGRTYNTDTGTRVAEHTNGHHQTDFGYISEDLYQTRHGAFFLHYTGGPRTCYAVSTGNGGSSGSSGLRPITPAQARQWLEYHQDTAAIERLFGEQPEAGQGEATLILRLPDSLAGQAKDAAAAASQSVNSWLMRIIESALRV